VLATGGGGIGVKNLGFAAIPIASNKSSSTVDLGEIAGSFVDVLSDFIELDELLASQTTLGVVFELCISADVNRKMVSMMAHEI